MLLRDRRQLVPHDGSCRCASLGGHRSATRYPSLACLWPLRLLLGGGFRPTASTARPFDRWSRWRCVVQVGRCANFCLFKGDKCKVTLSLQPTRAARAQHARKHTHAHAHTRARRDLYARTHARTHARTQPRWVLCRPARALRTGSLRSNTAPIPTARTTSSAPRLASQGFSFSPIASKCVLHSEAYSAPNLDTSTPFEYYERDPSRVYRHAPLLPA